MSIEKVTIVTTFGRQQYIEYGRNFLKSSKKHLHADINLICYIDGLNTFSTNELQYLSNFQVIDFDKEITTYAEFKNFAENTYPICMQRNKGTINTKVTKFAYKVFAQYHAYSQLNDAGILIFLDADTVLRKSLTPEFLSTCISKNHCIASLGREKCNFHTETGVIIWNVRHPACFDFFQDYIDLYHSGQIFHLPKWHDCTAFDEVISRQKLKEKGFIRQLGDPSKLNILPTSELSEYMVHKKGNRKFSIFQKIKKRLSW